MSVLLEFFAWAMLSGLLLVTFSGLLLWLIQELFGGANAYRNNWRGRASMAVRDFFLF